MFTLFFNLSVFILRKYRLDFYLRINDECHVKDLGHRKKNSDVLMQHADV